MADLFLVDNDARLLELYTLFLERRGHTLRTATSFHEARARLAEAPPELLLADLELGAERGDEELARLAQSGALPPTLVVSGYLDRELGARLAALPCVVGTLAKPFDLATLEARIAEALECARVRAS
jgi:two-component system nitrogen regulation response regulator NtrX